MRSMRWLALAIALWPLTSFAGHGLLNSFSDLTWLPPPGRTPDQWNYVFDAWQERLSLARAKDNPARYVLCQTFMRDKLAELEAMVSAGNKEAAGVAVSRYGEYRERATALAAQTPTLRERLAKTLLEHQYMLSVDYPDLPPTSRTVVADLIEDIGQRYTALRAPLPRAVAESLFFKEEEVRWSWQMGKGAVAPPVGGN